MPTIAHIHATLRQAVAARHGVTRQPELREGGDELQGDVHGDGLRGVKDVANGVEIEGGGLFEEGEATQEKGIGEVGSLEMGGVVLRCE